MNNTQSNYQKKAKFYIYVQHLWQQKTTNIWRIFVALRNYLLLNLWGGGAIYITVPQIDKQDNLYFVSNQQQSINLVHDLHTRNSLWLKASENMGGFTA